MAQTIVIFGASGDLTSRKLIPALYELHRKGRLPPDTRVVGVARTVFSHEAWREKLAQSVGEFVGAAFDPACWQSFAPSIFYQAGDVQRANEVRSLAAELDRLDGGRVTRIYYLATAPQLYQPAIDNLGALGMADESAAPRRVVIEKPFGTDCASARRLNEVLHRAFAESQVYRIDHYLGKETVQNVLVLRFANTILEPIWNRNYIDHVQITAAEEGTIGHRAGYYDSTGVVRDMFQNHLLQLLTLTAMEAPAVFSADSIRDEKVKVLRAIPPMTAEQVATDTLRGQYGTYTGEPGVADGSRTATFAAVRFCVENWRWKGVPFYLRSGKAMSCRTTQIVIQFREPPHMLFESGPRTTYESNRLVLQIQPAEGIQLQFHTKVPDAGMRLRMTDLDFNFRRAFAGRIPDSYQRLLVDVMNGDASLFARSDEVELAWGIIDPILAAWESTDRPELSAYEPGGWGPANSSDWMAAQGRQWFDVCPVLH